MAINLAENGSTIKTDSQSHTVGNSLENTLITMLCKEKDITLTWIPREQNTHADLLCHQERNNVIRTLEKLDKKITPSKRNQEAVLELENILKVGQIVTQQKEDKEAKRKAHEATMLAQQKAKAEKRKANIAKAKSHAETMRTQKKAKADKIKANIAKAQSKVKKGTTNIFNHVTLANTDETTVERTKNINTLLDQYKSLNKKLERKKAESQNLELDITETLCVEVVAFLTATKKQKQKIYTDLYIKNYLIRGNVTGEKVGINRFFKLAQEREKYIIGTKQSFKLLVNMIIQDEHQTV